MVERIPPPSGKRAEGDCPVSSGLCPSLLLSQNNEGKMADGDCPLSSGICSSLLQSQNNEAQNENSVIKDTTQISSFGEVSINTLTPSPQLKRILEGQDKPSDSGNLPLPPPPWLDKQLFDQGRKFYKRYLFCLNFSDLLSLIMMFSTPRSIKPLIFTGRSDTVQKALQRYFSTMLHIITWYSGDVWDSNDPAHKDILSIRNIHGKMARLVNSPHNNKKVANISVEERGYDEPACPYYVSIQKDVMPLSEDVLGCCSENASTLYLNQFDMSLTQYSFMGLLLAHPKSLGAGAATDKEFESLIHFWRGLGWLLGIEDQYNFCSGNLAETRAMCLEIERLVAIPCLSRSDWNYEYMSTCLMKGINTLVPCISFPAMFRYLADLMEIPVPEFVSRMSFIHLVHYWTIKFTFGLIFLIPSLVLLLNRMSENLFEKVQQDSLKSSGKYKVQLTKNVYR